MYRVMPFLNPEQDVIISLEQIRHSLLVLHCLCPGSAVLLGNLLRHANVSEHKSRDLTLAGNY